MWSSIIYRRILPHHCRHFAGSRNCVQIFSGRNIDLGRYMVTLNNRRTAVRSMATTSGAVTLKVTPRDTLVDTPVTITARGLAPGQPVTMVTRLADNGVFMAHAHYIAGPKGDLDLSRDISQEGTYTGVENMGLFWSMVQAEGQKPGLRLMKRDVTTPFTVELSLLDGHHHVTGDAILEKSRVLASDVASRWYMDAGVVRIPVRTGRIRGALFLPRGKGPFPGLIDLFGTAGGLNDFRAALLASRGFAAFSLAFFGYEDLPKALNFDLEYMDEAIQWLSSHPDVISSKVGVVGVSKGAELALHMAAYNDKIGAAVAINSYYYMSSAIHRFRGKPFPALGPELHLAEMVDGAINIRRGYWEVDQDQAEEAVIKVELAKGELLLLNCGDDQMCDIQHGERIVERLRTHGKTNFRHIIYPDAGHLLEPPYTPLGRVTFHKLIGGMIVMGGHTLAHARAQEQSWSEILAFLTEHLPKAPSTAKL